MVESTIEKRTLDWHEGRPSVRTAAQLPLGAGEMADLLDAIASAAGDPVKPGQGVVYRYADDTFVRENARWVRVLWTF